MTVFEAARTHMIESQLRPNKVTDDRVLDAFSRIRRELFVPEHLRSIAYVDEDLPLGRGRYLMEPMVAARLIQAASPERIGTALVVGAGTGYEAAVLSMLARTVVALEEDAELARLARAALVEENIASVSVVEEPLACRVIRRGHPTTSCCSAARSPKCRARSPRSSRRTAGSSRLSKPTRARRPRHPGDTHWRCDRAARYIRCVDPAAAGFRAEAGFCILRLWIGR